jgi:hypothetical protein
MIRGLDLTSMEHSFKPRRLAIGNPAFLAGREKKIAKVRFPSQRRELRCPDAHSQRAVFEFRMQRLSNRGSRNRAPRLPVSSVVENLIRPLTDGRAAESRAESCPRSGDREGHSQEASPNPTCANDRTSRLLAARSRQYPGTKQTIDRYALEHPQRLVVVLPNPRSNPHTIGLKRSHKL